MSTDIRFSRRIGGYVVTYMRQLRGIILEPEYQGCHWRFISQWGDLVECDTLYDAQMHATQTLLLDAT